MVGGLLRVKGGCVHFDIVPPHTHLNDRPIMKTITHIVTKNCPREIIGFFVF